MRPIHFCAALPLLLAGPVPALSADAEDDTRLEPTLVTASRSSESLRETLAAATVITRADIERLQAVDLIDVFKGLPGVSVSNTGGPGKETSVFLRGTESDHLLVLIDGVKTGSATTGKTAFDQIPIEQIERIEIVRGPRSSLYGSEAIGGVIQIFTRRGQAQAPTPTLTIAGGNYGNFKGEVGLSGSAGAVWYAASLGYRDTDGFNAQPESGEPDKDGFEQQAMSLRGGWRFEQGGEWSAHYLRADGESEYDSAWTPGADRSDTQVEVLGTQVRLPPLSFWTAILSGGISRDRSDTLLDGLRSSRFETERRHYSWLNEFQPVPGQQLTLGADLVQDEVDSSTEYERRTRDVTGVFAQYQGRFGAHDWQFSVRHDDDEQFGTYDTGAVAWGWQLDPNLRFSAHYGSAFRAPSFNELYYPGFGNPDLDPETSRSAEIGLDADYRHWRWGLRAYHTDIDELIATVLVDPDQFLYLPQNVDKARIIGAEAVIAAQIDAFHIQTSLSWLDPEARAGADDGKVLRRRAQQTARVDLDYVRPRMTLGTTLYASGKRYEDSANTVVLGGYATVALRTELRITRAVRLQASVDNLFDRDYETAYGYAQAGTSYWLTLRYTPSL